MPCHINKDDHYCIAMNFLSIGNDILVPFLKACERKQFILVVVKYFTKWIKVEALEEITINKVISFL